MMTPRQANAIHRVLDLLAEAGVPYQITGGFAGILHGSKWPLHDIDLDVGEADMEAVTRAFGKTVTRPPALYRDDEFDLVLLEADVDGLEIDVSQAEGARIMTARGWEPMGVELARREFIEWAERVVPVIPLADLIAYKRRLPARRADVAELESL